jgi:hypothetical protein
MPVEIDGVNYLLVEEWATALESGKYQQTKRVLHNRYGNCCIGVLCEEAGLPSRPGHYDGELEFQFPFDPADDYEKFSITTAVGWCVTGPSDEYMSHYGLSAAGTPLHTKATNEPGLMAMNDARDRNFKYIAAKLREWKEKGWIHDPQ